MKRCILAGLFLALLPAVAATAAAQTCGGRAAIVGTLERDHGERLAAQGVAGTGYAVMMLYTARDGATWTLLLRLADGNHCLVSAGRGWEAGTGGSPPTAETRMH